ncbi:hypothetical protein PSTG_07548 [Puccinia striiformis f. sp. tritici PST-78]|uniref:Cullin family profile domain-containing protein n=1 Tax=Puccinia striiformis f. sp. tritici PST-78 TaxID=1165861 RepID=A0A0L0VIX7_9BASI|nr:hypothetical protein PSTG_07548 [Puccinia striiformis f. sp. tritici PST-78]
MRVHEMLQLCILASSGAVRVALGVGGGSTIGQALEHSDMECDHTVKQLADGDSRRSNPMQFGSSATNEMATDHGWRDLAEKRKYEDMDHTIDSILRPGRSFSIPLLHDGGGSNTLDHKKPKTGSVSFSEEIYNMEKCRIQTLEDWKSWKDHTLKLKIDSVEKYHISDKLDSMINIMELFFERRFRESSGHKDVFPVYFSNGEAQKEFIRTSLEFGKMLKNLKSIDFQMRSSILSKWYDLMLKFLSDFQKHGIFSNSLLSQFLNDKMGVDFISDVINNKRFPLFVVSEYLNFNIKKSLQQDLSTKGMTNMLHLLSDETWNHIQFRYSFLSLENNMRAGSTSAKFIKIYDDFLKLAQPDKLQTLGSSGMDNLFTDLIEYISSMTKDEVTEIKPQTLYEFKVSYNMLRFVLTHSKQHISPHLMDEFKGSITFFQVKLFEEMFGMLTNIFHAVYIRAKVVLHNIVGEESDLKDIAEFFKTLQKVSSCFSDSNEDKRIFNFDVTDQEKYKQFTFEANFPERLHEIVSYLKSNIPSRLENGSEEVEKSIVECLAQYQRYQFQIKELQLFQTRNGQAQDPNSSEVTFSSVGNAFRMGCKHIKRFETELLQHINNNPLLFNCKSFHARK